MRYALLLLAAVLLACGTTIPPAPKAVAAPSPADVLPAIDAIVAANVNPVAQDMARTSGQIQEVQQEVRALRSALAKKTQRVVKEKVVVREVPFNAPPILTELMHRASQQQKDLEWASLKLSELGDRLDESMKMAHRVAAISRSPIGLFEKHGPGGFAGIIVAAISFFVGRSRGRKK